MKLLSKHKNSNEKNMNTELKDMVMNVGELKKFLKNIPDNTSITVTAPTTGYFHIEDATYERSGFYPMGLVRLYINDRQNCPFRHENGNCLAIGGFCLSVPDKECKAKKDRL